MLVTRLLAILVGPGLVTVGVHILLGSWVRSVGSGQVLVCARASVRHHPNGERRQRHAPRGLARLVRRAAAAAAAAASCASIAAAAARPAFRLTFSATSAATLALAAAPVLEALLVRRGLEPLLEELLLVRPWAVSAVLAAPMLVEVEAGQLFLIGVAQVVHLLVGLRLAVERLDGV